MYEKTTHQQVVDLFNEVLDALKAEYGAYNSERGEMRVNSDGITERERQRLHSYRVRLNDIYIP